MSRKQLANFSRQLATMQNAGLPIVRSLTVLEKQQPPGRFRNVVSHLAQSARQGSTLAAAMEKFPGVFDHMYRKMIEAGEMGGVLEEVLLQLTEMIEKSVRTRRKVIAASIYPACVLCFAILVVIFMLVFIVPSFLEMGRDMGHDTPASTQILLSVSNWTVNGIPPGWMVILFTPIGVYLLIRLIKRNKKGKFFIDTAKISVPVVGKIHRKIATSRAMRTLGMLISAGVPVLAALKISGQTSGNAVYAHALDQVHDAVKEGSDLATPMLRNRVIDKMTVDMVQIGEESGELDKMMMKIADNYDDEVDLAISAMLSLLQPALIIVLGVIVGTIALAMLAPYIQMISP